jgi:tetratricopeptide (TPR) repeat protein
MKAIAGGGGRHALIGLLAVLGGLLLSSAGAGAASDPAAPLELAVSAAEGRLRQGTPQEAEAHYQNALLEGWLLLGSLEKLDGQPAPARAAFANAWAAALESPLAFENRRALQSLALAEVNLGEASEAVEILTRFVEKHPDDASSRRLLAHALLASGQAEQAAQQLEAAHAAAPDDPELAFALAQDCLRMKRVEAADRLFAQVLSQRSIPAAHVLVGRAYRDADERERARTHLRVALGQDPRVRRAHYYLGTLILADDETHADRLERAIAEFRAELELAPEDAPANDQLGMALIEAGRQAEALTALEAAARAEPRALYVGHVGRCLLELGRPEEAAVSLRRALQLAESQRAAPGEMESIHYQLGLALRRLGIAQEAAVHLAKARRLAGGRTAAARPEMELFSFDDAAREGSAPPSDVGPLADLSPEGRLELKRHATAVLARAYFNLGVMQAQRAEFSRAAERFERAAQLDPDRPQIHYSLGVACFNARRFAEAGESLARALAANPRDASLRRLTAMAWLNAEAYAKAVELLEGDPERRTDPELESAYGLALLRSGRAAEAEKVFARLAAERGESAEWSALAGRAQADQGKDAAALRSLQRALELDANVAGANQALGAVYLRQGRLADAEQALRAELRSRPGDVEAQVHLAQVLVALQRAQEAAGLLRSALGAKPEYVEAQLLLGRMLLDHDATAEALPYLESAVRLAPEDRDARSLLARAYQRLGRTDLARQQLEAARKLKPRR